MLPGLTSEPWLPCRVTWADTAGWPPSLVTYTTGSNRVYTSLVRSQDKLSERPHVRPGAALSVVAVFLCSGRGASEARCVRERLVLDGERRSRG